MAKPSKAAQGAKLRAMKETMQREPDVPEVDIGDARDVAGRRFKQLQSLLALLEEVENVNGQGDDMRNVHAT